MGAARAQYRMRPAPPCPAASAHACALASWRPLPESAALLPCRLAPLQELADALAAHYLKGAYRNTLDYTTISRHK